MALDPMTQTIAALAMADSELSECASYLGQCIKGDPVNDSPIQQQLEDIYAERAANAVRRNAIIAGGSFTPPTDADVTALQAAIVAVHQKIQASANATLIITLVSSVLAQYNSIRSA